MPHGKLAGWFKAPLHVLGSIPFAAASLVVPKVGKKYVRWRKEAEQDDVEDGFDTPEKAKVDLASQTILVRGVLRIYGIKT